MQKALNKKHVSGHTALYHRRDCAKSSMGGKVLELGGCKGVLRPGCLGNYNCVSNQRKQLVRQMGPILHLPEFFDWDP